MAKNTIFLPKIAKNGKKLKIFEKFSKKIFFRKIFENFRFFFPFFGQKSCFLPFSNFSRPKSKNTFWWTCPSFYYGHFKLSTRSIGVKMRMGGKFGLFCSDSEKFLSPRASKSQRWTKKSRFSF